MNIINIFDTISVEQKISDVFVSGLTTVDWNARAQNAGPKPQQ